VKVLFDTNVILDVLQNRQPHAQAATQLVARIERKEITGYVCATTITTIFYLASKAIGAETAKAQIKLMLELFEVTQVDKTVLSSAMQTGFSDFEDAVLYKAAQHSSVDCIVTRNIKDFKQSKLPVYLPAELEAILELR
jgi:predicted nucleic acid-binding protein